MRVCLLVPDLSRSGGIDVVQAHARRLTDEHDAEVAVVPVASPAAVADARSQEWDVALATWWTTIPYLHALRATRRGVLAQGFDPLHYRPEEFVDRLAATAALAAPFDVIAVSEWVCEMVQAIRPSASCTVVRPGIDKELFGGARRVATDGPLRILVEGQPTLWFKGIAEALRAAGAMQHRPHVTLVALDPAGLGAVAADRVVGGLGADAMAALYREADVVLKLSRFEGLGLAPLEAFHAGVPCVVTPYGGHSEYLRHRENGLLVGFDDGPGTTRALDLLDADRGLLARLSEGALRTAEQWPAPAQASVELHQAMGGLSPGDADPALLEAVVRQLGPARAQVARLNGTVAARDRALAHELDRVLELDASRQELSVVLKERQSQLEEAGDRIGAAEARIHELAAEIEEATSSRAYRAAIALRSLLPGRR
ncbi:MAG: hypothetical protein QOG68_817 [Solirubrobacteraceae bacterium]|nr:hypothetical protein [Solirubrobacteraceae bacterium]